tara:strand:+ start:144 stop:395 length:252 start_codon:yes stop_codon:yes gene_type:complete
MCEYLSAALPSGWELAEDSKGRKYYINHITQETTWDDPREQLKKSSYTPSSSVANGVSPAVVENGDRSSGTCNTPAPYGLDGG